jgi:hypothetical protein
MRKTALMQRVNAAYSGNEMLWLLELQFEVDHWLMYEMQVSPRGGRVTPGLMDKALSHEISAGWRRWNAMSGYFRTSRCSRHF